MLRSVALLLALIAAPVCAQQRSLEDFFREFTDEWIRGNPNQAAATRYFTGAEQTAFERQLTPETRAYRQGRVRLARKGLAELAKFDRSRMAHDQRISADLMKWQLSSLVEGEAYEDYRFPIDQFNGPNVGIVNTLTVQHPMVTPDDARNYVARLGQVRMRMEEAITEAERLKAKGMIPPRFILRSTLSQLEQFIGTAPAQNPLVAVFAERMRGIDALPADERDALRANAEKIVASDVYPAWKKAIALLDSIVPASNDDAGLWRFKGGDKAYAYALRRFTTTKLSADQIHAIGLREVARIEGEMDKVFRSIGRADGSIKDRTQALSRDLAYPNTDEGRAAIMTNIDRILRDAEKRSQDLFAETPKAPVIAKPYPQFRWASAAASYSFPAPDGSRPGTFQMPLRPSQLTQFALRSLVYHETVPGHHFQIALEMENKALRVFGRSAPMASSRLSARAGRSTPSTSLPNRAGMRAIRRDFSARSTPSSSARGASSWTRASTPSTGRASRRSPTASVRARSSAMSCSPARRARTCWAS